MMLVAIYRTVFGKGYISVDQELLWIQITNYKQGFSLNHEMRLNYFNIDKKLLEKDKKRIRKLEKSNLIVMLIRLKLNLIYLDQIMGIIEKTSRIHFSFLKS
ncbi:unnamed protein product [Paramecium octaurelia]|uniref:Uncharacterized protein n=1 Tax=Paramecium octaurelia TaxID=43137 RepID=A0A8S1XCR9_PAROT|nr:unnamed protein product [Paramecium octaurelia]